MECDWSKQLKELYKEEEILMKSGSQVTQDLADSCVNFGFDTKGEMTL